MTTLPIFDATFPAPKFTLAHLWNRLSGKAERDAWEAGHKNGWCRGLIEAAALSERLAAKVREPELKKELSLLAKDLRGVLPEKYR